MPLRTLTQAEFDQIVVRHRTWLSSKVTGGQSARAELVGVDLVGSKLRWPARASLAQADFTGARLDGLALPAGIDLRAADFTGASLKATDFSAVASLASAICRGIDATAADFSGRNLDNADFGPTVSRSQLDAARFTGASLRSASFRGADLTRAQFDGATLTHADFTDAELAGIRKLALDACVTHGSRFSVACEDRWLKLRRCLNGVRLTLNAALVGAFCATLLAKAFVLDALGRIQAVDLGGRLPIELCTPQQPCTTVTVWRVLLGLEGPDASVTVLGVTVPYFTFIVVLLGLAYNAARALLTYLVFTGRAAEEFSGRSPRLDSPGWSDRLRRLLAGLWRAGNRSIEPMLPPSVHELWTLWWLVWVLQWPAIIGIVIRLATWGRSTLILPEAWIG